MGFDDVARIGERRAEQAEVVGADEPSLGGPALAAASAGRRYGAGRSMDDVEGVWNARMAAIRRVWVGQGVADRGAAQRGELADQR